MQFDIVKLFYPEGWRKIQNHKKSRCNFNWFLCSKRVLDSLSGMYYIRVSVTSQFYCEKTGISLLPRGLYKKDVVVQPRLLILSDPHNKKRIKELKFELGCDSKRSTLSTECKLTCDTQHLKKAAKFAVSLGFDGVVIRHDCTCKKSELTTPLCYQSTFVFRDKALIPATKTDPQRCGIIKYAKKYNSKIREEIQDFPNNKEIDKLLFEYPCNQISKILYSYIRN